MFKIPKINKNMSLKLVIATELQAMFIKNVWLHGLILK